jgi:hypothetical protein
MDHMLDMVHYRWVKKDKKDVSCWVLPEHAFVEAPSNASIPRERFNHVNAIFQSLASLAGRSDQMY